MVSIILVNYGGSKDTIECIQSIEDSGEKDYQIIVVDNASPDDSVAVLEAAQKDHNFILIKSDVNGGFSAGNNLGIQYALEHDTDYVLLLNNDTIVTANFLDELLKPFAKYPDCGATIGKILYNQDRSKIWYGGGAMDPQTARTQHFFYDEIDHGQADKEQSVSFATGCCLCLSAKTIKDVGLLDDSYFLYEEDVDYCYRIAKAGYQIIYHPQAVIYHKVSASTGRASATTQYYSIRNKYLLIQKNYPQKIKWKAYAYTTLKFFVRCLKGSLKLRYLRMGLKAFRSGEQGKRENSLV